MSSEKKKPPTSAKELLERYAVGERDFTAAKLAGVNLEGATLTDANFQNATFESANLSYATLAGANFTGATLAHARIANSESAGAMLIGANLAYANLVTSNLFRVDFSGADLSNSHLSSSDLSNSDLSDSNLFGADLVGTILHEASITRANLSRAKLAHTVLSNLDLSSLCHADPPVEHEGPSIIDYRAVTRSLHSPKLKTFLQHAGMPEVFIEYMIDCARTLDSRGVFNLLQSTFLSYGSPDEFFARRLYEALHRNGVTTFFFPEHAVPGKKLGRMMRQGVNDYDRIVLVCSKDSLDRKPVLAELEHSLAREDREGGTALIIPMLLDDYLFSGWNPPHPDVLLTLKDRVAADFRGWDTDSATFDRGLQRLISALKK